MTDHTPEPWGDRFGRNGVVYLSTRDWLRAKACVNACAGIPTEQLGDGCVAAVLAALQGPDAFRSVVSRYEALNAYKVDAHGPDHSELEELRAEIAAIRAALAPFRKESIWDGAHPSAPEITEPEAGATVPLYSDRQKD